MHGSHDQVIPLAHGREVFDEYRRNNLVIVGGKRKGTAEDDLVMVEGASHEGVVEAEECIRAIKGHISSCG